MAEFAARFDDLMMKSTLTFVSKTVSRFEKEKVNTRESELNWGVSYYKKRVHAKL